jgi:hypothetical protein
MEIKMLNKKKKAQEEIVGFALIIIIVAVILLFFINFYIRSGEKESVENYEVNSFIQAFLHYTTDCKDYLEYLSVHKLILECDDDAWCLDDRKTCDVLNSTLRNIVDKTWKVGEDEPVKGYELKITANEEELPFISFMEGNITGNYKGAGESLPKSGYLIKILFRAYY